MSTKNAYQKTGIFSNNDQHKRCCVHESRRSRDSDCILGRQRQKKKLFSRRIENRQNLIKFKIDV